MPRNGVLQIKWNAAFISAILGALLGLAATQPACALTADDVLNKMDSDQRYFFLAGLIEGMGYARFLREKPETTGSKCIYNWYFEGGEANKRKIKTWFERHLDKPASTLLYVLVKKDCGE